MHDIYTLTCIPDCLLIIYVIYNNLIRTIVTATTITLFIIALSNSKVIALWNHCNIDCFIGTTLTQNTCFALCSKSISMSLALMKSQHFEEFCCNKAISL